MILNHVIAVEEAVIGVKNVQVSGFGMKAGVEASVTEEVVRI